MCTGVIACTTFKLRKVTNLMNGSSWKVKYIPSYKLGIKNWITNFFLAEISCQKRKEIKLFKMKQQKFIIFSVHQRYHLQWIRRNTMAKPAFKPCSP